MQSIVFLASAAFSAEVLEFILQHSLANVKVIWTKNETIQKRNQAHSHSKIIFLAKEKKIPFFCPSSITSEDILSLKKIKVDLGLVISYGLILPKNFFSIPKYGMFNVHFSILPKYRGASPIQSVIIKGEETTGISIQKINEKMDQGDISMKDSFEIKDKTAPQVFDLATKKTKHLLQTFFKTAPGSFLNLSSQDHSQASYCFKIKKEDGRVTPKDNALNIFRKFKAYLPWPGIFFSLKGKKHELLDLIFYHQEDTDFSNLPSGTLINKGKKSLLLILKEGVLEVKKIKKENKKALEIPFFLNGFRHSFPIIIDE